MATLASLVVQLEANTARFQRDMERASGVVKGFERGIRNMLGFALGAAGIGSLGAAFAAVAKATQDAERSTARLNAVLRATGNAAGLTSQQVERMVGRLTESTLFDDDALRVAASQLLTFRNIQGETFERGLELAADLSEVLDQDLRSSVIQLGKALNDPVAGITALSRVGIQFTETQKQQIRVAQEFGNVLGAQKIILDEIAAQVGGAAGAANTGLTGAINALTDAMDTLYESIGKNITQGGIFATVAKGIENTIKGWASIVTPLGRVDELNLQSEQIRGALAEGGFGGLTRGARIAGIQGPLGSTTEEFAQVRARLEQVIEANDAAVSAINRRARAEEAAAEAAARAGAASQRAQLTMDRITSGIAAIAGVKVPAGDVSGLARFSLTGERNFVVDRSMEQFDPGRVFGRGYQAEGQRFAAGILNANMPQLAAGQAITQAAGAFDAAASIVVGSFARMAQAAVTGSSFVANAIAGVFEQVIATLRAQQSGGFLGGIGGALLGPIGGLVLGGLTRAISGGGRQPVPVQIESYSARAATQMKDITGPTTIVYRVVGGVPVEVGQLEADMADRRARNVPVRALRPRYVG